MKKVWIWGILIFIYVAVFAGMIMIGNANIRNAAAAGMSETEILSNLKIIVPIYIAFAQIPIAIIVGLIMAIVGITKISTRNKTKSAV